MRMILAVLALIVPVAATASGEERNGGRGCDAELAGIEVEGPGTYNPFEGGDLVNRLRIGIRADGDCDLGLTFRSSNGGRLLGGRDRLSYTIQDRSGRLVKLDGVSRRRAQTLDGQGRQDLLEALVVVPAGQPVRPGSYSDVITVELLDRQKRLGTGETRIDATVVPFASLRAARSARTAFASAGGASLDFGVLETNEEEAVYLLVQSNSRYVLDLSSENGGRLRRVSGDGGPASTIDYTARLDRSRIDLQRPVRFGPRASRGGREPDPIELRVRIGDITNKLAGTYRDVITVEITAIE